MKLISIIIPCYNEAASLPFLLKQLEKIRTDLNDYDFEYLFIDDGSSDYTLELLRQLNKKNKKVNYIELSRNFGKEAAMLAGFDYASGEAAIIMDADLQHPPEKIKEMIKCWEEGYDDVYMVPKQRQDRWFRKKMSKLFRSLTEKISSENIYPQAGDFRLLDQKCIQALRQLRESERYTKAMYTWIGFKKKGLVYEEGERVAGKTKWSYRKLLNLAINGFMSYSTLPLRLSSYLGLFISSLAFIYLAYELIKTIFFGSDIAGYPTLIASILLLGGIQLISLGIIGEYLSKVFIETKNRPTYITRQSSKKKSPSEKNQIT